MKHHTFLVAKMKSLILWPFEKKGPQSTQIVYLKGHWKNLHLKVIQEGARGAHMTFFM